MHTELQRFVGETVGFLQRSWLRFWNDMVKLGGILAEELNLSHNNEDIILSTIDP